MDDFRGNLFSTNNTKWTIYRYTRFTIYIVEFVLFVLKNIVKFVFVVPKRKW